MRRQGWHTGSCRSRALFCSAFIAKMRCCTASIRTPQRFEHDVLGLSMRRLQDCIHSKQKPARHRQSDNLGDCLVCHIMKQGRQGAVSGGHPFLLQSVRELRSRDAQQARGLRKVAACSLHGRLHEASFECRHVDVLGQHFAAQSVERVRRCGADDRLPCSHVLAHRRRGSRRTCGLLPPARSRAPTTPHAR